MVQTVYSQSSDTPYAGVFYDAGVKDVMSYSAEGAVSFGKPVALGTNKERQVKALTTAVGQGALAVGIALAQHNEQSSAGLVEYGPTDTVSVLKKGRVWVATDDAVVAGAKANLKLSSGLFTDEAVAAGIEAFTQFTATFITSTSGAGLAVVEVK